MKKLMTGHYVPKHNNEPKHMGGSLIKFEEVHNSYSLNMRIVSSPADEGKQDKSQLGAENKEKCKRGRKKTTITMPEEF